MISCLLLYSYSFFKFIFSVSESVSLSVMSDSCNPMDCRCPGSAVCGILQARILERAAIPFSKGSSQPRDQTWVSCIAGRFFTVWDTSWRIIALQCWVAFCLITTWIGHKYTYVPYLLKLPAPPPLHLVSFLKEGEFLAEEVPWGIPIMLTLGGYYFFSTYSEVRTIEKGSYGLDETGFTLCSEKCFIKVGRSSKASENFLNPSPR